MPSCTPEVVCTTSSTVLTWPASIRAPEPSSVGPVTSVTRSPTVGGSSASWAGATARGVDVDHGDAGGGVGADHRGVGPCRPRQVTRICVAPVTRVAAVTTEPCSSTSVPAPVTQRLPSRTTIRATRSGDPAGGAERRRRPHRHRCRAGGERGRAAGSLASSEPNSATPASATTAPARQRRAPRRRGRRADDPPAGPSRYGEAGAGPSVDPPRVAAGSSTPTRRPRTGGARGGRREAAGARTATVVVRSFVGRHGSGDYRRPFLLWPRPGPAWSSPVVAAASGRRGRRRTIGWKGPTALRWEAMSIPLSRPPCRSRVHPRVTPGWSGRRPLPTGPRSWVVRPDCGGIVVFAGHGPRPRRGSHRRHPLEYEAYDEQVVPRPGAGRRPGAPHPGAWAAWRSCTAPDRSRSPTPPWSSRSPRRTATRRSRRPAGPSTR